MATLKKFATDLGTILTSMIVIVFFLGLCSVIFYARTFFEITTALLAVIGIYCLWHKEKNPLTRLIQNGWNELLKTIRLKK